MFQWWQANTKFGNRPENKYLFRPGFPSSPAHSIREMNRSSPLFNRSQSLGGALEHYQGSGHPRFHDRRSTLPAPMVYLPRDKHHTPDIDEEEGRLPRFTLKHNSFNVPERKPWGREYDNNRQTNRVPPKPRIQERHDDVFVADNGRKGSRNVDNYERINSLDRSRRTSRHGKFSQFNNETRYQNNSSRQDDLRTSPPPSYDNGDIRKRLSAESTSKHDRGVQAKWPFDDVDDDCTEIKGRVLRLRLGEHQ